MLGRARSVLGLGLLPAVDYAAKRLLRPGAIVVPGRVRVRPSSCAALTWTAAVLHCARVGLHGSPLVAAIQLRIRLGAANYRALLANSNADYYSVR